jgi:O-antigen ligase
LIVGTAVGGAILAGVAMGVGVGPGVAVTMALCYMPLVLLNLQAAIVLWLPTIALIAVGALGPGPNLAGAMIVLAWLAALVGRNSEVQAAVVLHRRLLLPLGALIFWVLLSVAWAEHPYVGSDVFVGWLIAGAIVLVISTSLTNRLYQRIAVGAIVAGAVFSVLLGLFGGAVEEETGRVVGGTGDPNGLAAGIVPAIVLALGLAASSRRLAVRASLLVGVGIMTIGFLTTESRGGFVGAIVAAVAALVLAKRHRAWVVSLILCVLGVAAVWTALDPEAWQRLSDFNDSTGRSELWGVASQMWQDHPLVGVGLEGFADHAGGYVRDLGPIKYAQFIVEEQRVVHNTYLELLAETGILGLALFITVAVAALRSGLRAATLFDRAGDGPMAVLARSVVVGLFAMLSSAAFISGENDRRFWVLLALGPAMLAAAQRSGAATRDAAHPPRRPIRSRRAPPRRATPSHAPG